VTIKYPNILWICTGQQRHDTIHALGNAHIHAPTLDKRTTEDVTFTSAYCQSPIGTPSGASFLMGRHPSHVPVFRKDSAYCPDDARLATLTLADAGCDSGLTDKLPLSAVSR